jgi:hypothetical protein
MYSASVGENKQDFDNIKIHGTTTKIDVTTSKVLCWCLPEGTENLFSKRRSE